MTRTDADLTELLPRTPRSTRGLGDLTFPDYTEKANRLGLEGLERARYYRLGAKRHREAIAAQEAWNLRHYKTTKNVGRLRHNKELARQGNASAAFGLETMAARLEREHTAPAAELEELGRLAQVIVETEDRAAGLEAAGGPRRLQEAARLREHAKCWRHRQAELAGAETTGAEEALEATMTTAEVGEYRAAQAEAADAEALELEKPDLTGELEEEESDVARRAREEVELEARVATTAWSRAIADHRRVTTRAAELADRAHGMIPVELERQPAPGPDELEATAASLEAGAIDATLSAEHAAWLRVGAELKRLGVELNHQDELTRRLVAWGEAHRRAHPDGFPF